MKRLGHSDQIEAASLEVRALRRLDGVDDIGRSEGFADLLGAEVRRLDKFEMGGEADRRLAVSGCAIPS
jgi:hypothetical protein